LALSPEGEGDDPEADAVALDDRRLVRVLAAPVRAVVRDGARVERVERPVHAVGAEVEDVVVRRRQEAPPGAFVRREDVEAGFAQRQARTGLVREPERLAVPAGDDGLEVGHREVGVEERRFDPTEQAPRRAGHEGVRHDVAGGHDAHRGLGLEALGERNVSATSALGEEGLEAGAAPRASNGAARLVEPVGLVEEAHPGQVGLGADRVLERAGQAGDQEDGPVGGLHVPRQAHRVGRGARE
jgi:hypothetical protein